MTLDLDTLTVKDAKEMPKSVRGRKRKPNPLVPVVKESRESKQPKQVAVPNDDDSIKDIQRLLRQAAAELECGVSIRVSENGAPKGKVNIVFQGRDKRTYRS